MKKLFLTLGLVGGSPFSMAANPMALLSQPSLQMSPEAAARFESQTLKAIRAVEKKIAAKQAVDWVVGDYQTHKIQFLFPGTAWKVVDREDDSMGQAAVWLKQTTRMMFTNQISEQLIARGDGSVLKTLIDGVEQAPSTEEPQVEVIEQAEDVVTVPAGTFDCMYVKAVVTQVGQAPQTIEMWANPIDINMDGSLKVIAQSPMGPMTMLLKEFGPRS